jgi:hypothetical protein
MLWENVMKRRQDYFVAVKECCIKILCARIPPLLGYAEHCWIEKKNCNDTTENRFDLWQGGIWALLFGGIPASVIRDGQIAMNIWPSGDWFPGPLSAPHTIYQNCFDCTADDEPCQCIDEEMKSYKWKNTYDLTGPNSNTFVGRMALYCGLIGELTKDKVPSTAVGWWHTDLDKPGTIGVHDPEREADRDELTKKASKAMQRRAKYRITGHTPPW